MKAEAENRNKKIIKYNIIGVVVNAVLSLMKITIGLMTGAHAVILDGVNSLSDMTSSILSILSAYFGGKKATRNHPMGFGRLEYIFSMIITMVIIYIGVRSVIDSVKTIITPDAPPKYDLMIIIVMCISLVAKMAYGILLREKGRELDSIAMKMAGTESCGDGLIAVAILVAILVYKIWNVDIEHYLCIAISLLIIYTGVRMVIECMVKILGERVDQEYKREILKLLLSEEEVLNVSNLVLHNYGEKIYVGSVDIEVDEKMPAVEISRLSRKLIRRAEEAGLTLTSVGVTAANISDPKAYEIWDTIIDTARKHKGILGVNSFVVDFEENVISFYVVPDRSLKNVRKEMKDFENELQEKFPDLKIEILEGLET